jgi:murein DD-endopeptidase MepM/ murein hydrolase activator NlpD
MNKFDLGKNNRNGFGRIGMLLTLLLVIIALSYGAYRIFLIPEPVLRGIEAFNLLPLRKTVTLRGENIRSIDISVYQGGKKIQLLRDTPEISEKKYLLEIKPKDLGLTNGPALIVINTKSGILKKAKYEVKAIIDTVPPTLEVLKAPTIIYQGSGGLAVLRVKNADSVFVKLVDPISKDTPEKVLNFKAFKATQAKEVRSASSSEYEAEPGSSRNRTRKNVTENYYVFIPAPFDIKEGNLFYAVARDLAGNQNIKALPTSLKTRNYRESSITIEDSFINKVVAPLLNKVKISDPESAFRRINEEWRKENTERIIDIAQNTDSRILWEGRFLQLKNSKVMATYGDKRSYIYKGKTISNSVHLGYDLASFANAPVEAANTGIIRFVGDLGIYGDTVIIDHGLGLMTIYGHLSLTMVEEGQNIKRGEIIAKTGATGFAGGDHLHFGILLHGYEVSPLYWWDPKWIDIHINEYFSY